MDQSLFPTRRARTSVAREVGWTTVFGVVVVGTVTGWAAPRVSIPDWYIDRGEAWIGVFFGAAAMLVGFALTTTVLAFLLMTGSSAAFRVDQTGIS